MVGARFYMVHVGNYNRSQNLLFRCTANICGKARADIHAHTPALDRLPETVFCTRRFPLINYLLNVCMFMSHNFTFQLSIVVWRRHCNVFRMKLFIFFLWPFRIRFVSFCWFHFNCLFSSAKLTICAPNGFPLSAKMQSMSLQRNGLFGENKFIKFIECIFEKCISFAITHGSVNY